jgi:cation diffusion facilitator family transporter
MSTTESKPVKLTRYAWLSIAAAVVTILLKLSAYLITGSVGLLSDALESLVNLASALVALYVLKMIERPADERFNFGFSKAEYFSSGFEGGMILLAAGAIIFTAIPRLINPVPLEQVGLGLIISVIASLINLGVALVLLKAGKQYNSITLEADARHLITDVWTTAGVLVGIALVQLTGFLRLDPLVALLVAANIIFTGVRLLKRSTFGLMDIAIPEEDRDKIENILNVYKKDGLTYHALRTRQAAASKYVALHLLVPGKWTVLRGHQLADEIERKVKKALPNTSVVTHIEPLEDPESVRDSLL